MEKEKKKKERRKGEAQTVGKVRESPYSCNTSQ